MSTVEFLTLAMGPKKVSDIQGKKRMLLLKMKMEMIKKHKSGMKLTAIAKEWLGTH